MLIPILDPTKLFIKGKSAGINCIDYLVKNGVDETNNIFLLKSGTGTGKSVSIAPELRKKINKKIILLENLRKNLILQ